MLRLLPRSLRPLRSLSLASVVLRLRAAAVGAPQYSTIKPESPPSEAANQENDDSDTPWYLRENVASPLLEKREAPIPDVPTSAPPALESYLNLLSKKYGMHDIELFDMTHPDNAAHDFRVANPDVDYIIICSGKSEKHNFKAAYDLRMFLKKEQDDQLPRMEGMVSRAMSPLMRRRIARRGAKGPPASHNEYGRAANSWILCHHDHIDIHILTEKRRQELQLELLWCKPEDAWKYEQQDFHEPLSDDIFSGIRRLHTLARCNAASVDHSGSETASLQHMLDELHGMDANGDVESFRSMMAKFDQAFLPSLAQNFDVRYEFFRALHLLQPQLVPFETVQNVLLSKYHSVRAAMDPSIDFEAQKIDDVVRYLKLLLDTPAFACDDLKLFVDRRLHMASSFISTLYTNSTHEMDLIKNPQLIPLLYRLTYVETGEPVTLAMVDDVIFGSADMHSGRDPVPSVVVASNNARNIIDLLLERNSHDHQAPIFTERFNELHLFTLGNGGLWRKFWATLESFSWNLENSVDTASRVRKWVRLVVFLDLMNDRRQITHFFHEHFDHTTSFAGSLVQCWRANGSQFNNDEERHAVKRALKSMVAKLGGGKFEGVVAFADGL